MNNENPYKKDDMKDYKLDEKTSKQLISVTEKFEKASVNLEKKEKQFNDAKSKLDAIHQDYKIVYLQAKVELMSNNFSDSEADKYLNKYLSAERGI